MFHLIVPALADVTLAGDGQEALGGMFDAARALEALQAESDSDMDTDHEDGGSHEGQRQPFSKTTVQAQPDASYAVLNLAICTMQGHLRMPR